MRLRAKWIFKAVRFTALVLGGSAAVCCAGPTGPSGPAGAPIQRREGVELPPSSPTTQPSADAASAVELATREQAIRLFQAMQATPSSPSPSSGNSTTLTVVPPTPVAPDAGTGADAVAVATPAAPASPRMTARASRPRPSVQWVDVPPPDSAPVVAATAVEPAQPCDPAVTTGAKATTAGVAGSCDKSQLLDQLRQMMRAAKDPNLVRALSAVAMSLNDSRHRLDPADLAGLDEAQKQLVMSYHRLALMVAKPGGSGVGSGDVAIVAATNPVAESPTTQTSGEGASEPLKILEVKLCRRVRGYGVYDPFEDHRLLAGRDQRMIVYVAVDHFVSVPTDDTAFRVELVQEVSLFHESDGLVVWKQPEVKVTDESRTQRRDFFVVQMINLPSNLTVGKYLLKVRMRDVNGQSIDEATVPLHIIAGERLVSSSTTP